MNGITASWWEFSRVLSRAAAVGGLLVASAAPADDMSRPVQFTDGWETAPTAAPCPTPDCPPQWGPSYPAPPAAMPGAPARPAMPSTPQQPSTPGQPSAPQAAPTPQQSSPTLPQADPSSPVPAPFTAGAQPSQPAQAGVQPAGFSPGGLAAAAAPAPVAPNMIGDFFGAISSQPIILPGNLVRQAIFFEPTPMSGGPALIDYYRAVNELSPGSFQTDTFVFLASRRGQLINAVPSQVPPQLLTEFDDINGFAGDPVFITGGPDPNDPTMTLPPAPISNAGPFIALDAMETADQVDVVTAEGPALLIDEPLFNIYEALLVFAPTPGSGGGVGRQKIAENTSPIPRDRIFINHSTFTDVPLTGEGVNVYRFSPGVEKAFFEQRMSVEVRFPFASTLNSDIEATGGTDQESTEFGNVVTTLKGLVHQSCHGAVAIGVSVTAPTHSDLNVNDARGATLLGIENESVHVMPFIGGTRLRGRWFSQWFLQGDFDTTGSPVQIRDVITDTLQDGGTISDAPMLYASISGGYWIYQNGHRNVSFDSMPGKSIKRTVYTGGSGITGIAPIAEFHFNRSLDKGEVIRNGPIQYEAASDFSVSNLLLGSVFTFGTGGSLTAAWGTPIIGQDDKQYQSEIRVILDYEY